MNKLLILGQNHNEWLLMANKMGIGEMSEDMVQETYLRIIRLNYVDGIVKDDGSLNKFYMWLTIRAVHVDYLRANSQNFVSLDEVKESYEETDLEKHEALNTLDHKIHLEMESWSWYDSMLFKVYKEGNASMRNIANDSGISLTSIYNTLKNCKQRLRESVGEDYQDYINQDFDLI
jgi:DNA-directed RNA polymerase specialized sigma24 family protein